MKEMKKKGVKKSNDISLAWLERKYPEMREWRCVAIKWLEHEKKGVSTKLNALAAFLERFIVRLGLPERPQEFLCNGSVIPDFYSTACPDSKVGVAYTNIISSFLDYVLITAFSEKDAQGRLFVSPGYYNPIKKKAVADAPRLSESVRSPLPYGYIDQLRQILVEGLNFKDWRWAQNALGAEIGAAGKVAPDWFKVSDEVIDVNDPDCVWRRRRVGKTEVLEMWSPVRWLALLTKLILPLRTMQVRMLDSGEADTWRYAGGKWEMNKGALAEGSNRKPLQQGVFRRVLNFNGGDEVVTVLYVNTNKTADSVRTDGEKGYVLPWVKGGDYYCDIFYWLEKLRDWQEKYNPLSRRIAWSELDGRHIQAKSDVQLAGYPRACFLFRLPESEERSFPIREAGLDFCWFALLEKFSSILSERGEKHANGLSIKLVPDQQERTGYPTTYFPLHSLRVSLITALALDGKVPIPILQKIAGHSRVIMTLYYTKPGAAQVSSVLNEAYVRLEKSKAGSIQDFIVNSAHDELSKHAVCNDGVSAAAAIPIAPSARNPVGWMPMHHGLCLVGGNTSEIVGNSSVGGCYNGGAPIGNHGQSKNGPVPGGSRNCIRCRWFVTSPEYLPALVTHFNTVAYHFDEARNHCIKQESLLHAIKIKKIESEEKNIQFENIAEFRQAERVWESAMKNFSDMAENLVACYRLVEKCLGRLQEGLWPISFDKEENINLKMLRQRVDEVDSELLQLTGVCMGAEIYPDLNYGKAVIRRSQLLDAAIYKEGAEPIFMRLDEEQQLLFGNWLMKRMALLSEAGDENGGMRKVIETIDVGGELGKLLGVNLKSLISDEYSQGVTYE